MKYFTEPNGKFIIHIPTEWQYSNLAVGHEEVSPFSFQLYSDPVGAFQISCYSKEEKQINPNIKPQSFDARHLVFLKRRMDGEGFNVHLWFAAVEDHFFMAKYVYDTLRQNDSEVKEEMIKVESALASLQLLSPEKRKLAIELDKYEKFMASLSASFDLKNKALENESLIELLVIIGNQIDAYLRMALVMKKQLADKTNLIDITLLFQGENDTPIMERKIYSQAKEANIIDGEMLDKLEMLYKQRNKVIHRYIISEFKTRYLYEIIAEYEAICEKVRLALQAIENLQFKEQIGIHGNARNPQDHPSQEDINMLYSQINDKHLVRHLYREVKK